MKKFSFFSKRLSHHRRIHRKIVVETCLLIGYALSMTVLLEKAVHKINELPVKDQDAIASLILDEIEAERKWDQLFSSSQKELSKMASEAIIESCSGKTTPLDPDRDL
jgi:hypothetical protein